jgi:hypothetical protein
MDIKEMFKQGPSDVERWTQGLHTGIKRWKGVEQERSGLGDAFTNRGETFAEMSYSMREVKVRIRLGKTQQQRAIQQGSAKPARDVNAAKDGWVDVSVDADDRMQDAINLARQAYMETNR